MAKRKIRVNGRLYESTSRGRIGRRLHESENDKELETLVADILGDLDEDDIVEVWNEFCESPDGYEDDHIYDMGQFDEDFDGMSPLEIAREVQGSDFDVDDDYYYYNRNGNLSSTTDPAGYPIQIDWMVDYIVKSQDSLGNPDIQAVLDELTDD